MNLLGEVFGGGKFSADLPHQGGLARAGAALDDEAAVSIALGRDLVVKGNKADGGVGSQEKVKLTHGF